MGVKADFKGALSLIEMCKYTEQIEDLQPRYETLGLLDKLIKCRTLLNRRG
jgi:hypothetical protein